MLIHEGLELAAHPRNLALIHNGLDRFEAEALKAKGEEVAAVFDAFKTAVIEIATNIFRHAYPPDYPGASLTFQLFLFPQRLEAALYDHGIPFTQPLAVPSPALDEIEDILDVPEGKFGLFLALQALDALNYTRSPAGINEWRLIKNLP